MVEGGREAAALCPVVDDTEEDDEVDRPENTTHPTEDEVQDGLGHGL